MRIIWLGLLSRFTAASSLSESGFWIPKAGTALLPVKQAPINAPNTTTTGAESTSRPNIVFILTDDQDLHLDSLNYMPLLKQYITDEGTTYKRHFCTTAICCPARATIMTGKAAHNTNVTNVFPPYGGYPKFVAEGHLKTWLPVRMQQAGYSTYYTGKLFNAHTIYNYDKPFVTGWTGSDFLLDPNTYAYYNATFQRNQDPPINHEGEYNTDLIAEKALGFIDDGVASGKPFFVGVAPIAPHTNSNPNKIFGEGPVFTPPIPAERHAHLFPDARVPRTANFNPDKPSGVSWIRHQRKLSQENLDENDGIYRLRLRALQAVDEIVQKVVERLEQKGVLDNTYIFYTTDNGFHIGNHRLQPGKECGFEEDINVPFVVRGPGVAKGYISDSMVSSHADLVPTFLSIAGAPLASDLDGSPIPLDFSAIREAAINRRELVTVEYWGMVLAEGNFGFVNPASVESGLKDDTSFILSSNTTYKAIRVVSERYNLYFSVWCNNERELYDLTKDPGQLNNLLEGDITSETERLMRRLNALLLVTKTCKGRTCTHPWSAIHVEGEVTSLEQALNPHFDAFYQLLEKKAKVQFERCEQGYLLDAEGPTFEDDGLIYNSKTRWSDWT